MNFALAEEHYLIIRSKKEYGISLNDTFWSLNLILAF